MHEINETRGQTALACNGSHHGTLEDITLKRRGDEMEQNVLVVLEEGNKEFTMGPLAACCLTSFALMV